MTIPRDLSFLAEGANAVSGVVSLSLTGNVTTGNILTDGYYYANGAPFAGGGGGSGTPGGANTQIQFNDAGAFGGSAGLTFDKTTNAIATTGSFSATGNITGSYIIGNVVAGTGTGGNITGANLITAVTISASGNVIGNGATLGITSGTTVASTSGTSIDFTGIPSWVKRITVMFNGVSTNGISPVQVQIGSGSFTTTGYASGAAFAAPSSTTGATNSTTGFAIAGVDAGNTRHGHMVLTNITGNTWVSSNCGGYSDGAGAGFMGGGTVSISGTLDRVRITTINGTQTFDAGSINILYE